LNAVWKPPQEWIENANVGRFMQRLGFDDREAFLPFSRDESDRFRDEWMREKRVEWFEPYRQAMHASRGSEWAQWFVGGRLNRLPAPSMARGIWNDPRRHIDAYWPRFPGTWYHGDWVSVDEDGHCQAMATNLLNETDPQAFFFRDDALRWRDWRASTAETAQARREFANSFGSCSFEEPVNHLRALGFVK